MDYLLQDDDVRKLERLQLINASARYELLSANQQLIDFHLNRMMQVKSNKIKNINNLKVEQLEQSTEKVAMSARNVVDTQKIDYTKSRGNKNLKSAAGDTSNYKEVEDRIK